MVAEINTNTMALAPAQHNCFQAKDYFNMQTEQIVFNSPTQRE